MLETIVVISVTTLSLLALSNLFLVFNSIYSDQQASMATAGSAGAAMNALEAAVLPADHVLASHPFGGTTYTSGATTLVLELPAVDSSGSILAAKDYVVFYASSTDLYRLTAATAGSTRTSGTKLFSTTLSALSFTYDNADFTQVTSVTADIRTSAQVKQQAFESHLREQIYLRN